MSRTKPSLASAWSGSDAGARVAATVPGALAFDLRRAGGAMGEFCPSMTTPPGLRLSDFDFALPRELIAQHPAAERSAARLLDARVEPARDRHVRDLPDLLRAGDLLVVKASGGAVEALVERVEADDVVIAQVRASKSPKAGSVVRFADAFEAEVLGRAGN